MVQSSFGWSIKEPGDLEEMKETYILVAVGTEEATEASLGELSELLDTAGGEAVDCVTQNLMHPDPATYIGSGKAEELRWIMEEEGADGIVCDDELTPAQMRNLSDILEAKVLDRTMLILDIFAAHARTKEGKLQVEMAQLKYRSSRLSGMGKALSRLGGGIGTRGPGETKLETDRRVIKTRIEALSAEIRDMKQVRNTTRKRRMESAEPVAAVVGYTNAGKSTFLNRLTGSDVLSEDKLFATLDPTTRIFEMNRGQRLLLTDTVGFINKLPHHLIDAFRSTLEEAQYADFLIHIVDSSDPHAYEHCRVVYETLSALGIIGKPILTVWNKCDLPESDTTLRDLKADITIRFSAATGEGMERLTETIGAILNENREYIDIVVPYQDQGKTAMIRKYGELLSEEYLSEGVHVTAYVPKRLLLQYGLKGY